MIGHQPWFKANAEALKAVEADDVRVCGRLGLKAIVDHEVEEMRRCIHPLVAEEYEMHGITTMDSDWWATRTQRDFDGMYEQQAQCAAEPDPLEVENQRMRETITELSRRPTLEQYLRACEHVAELSALILKLTQPTAGAPSPRFPANALKHSV